MTSTRPYLVRAFYEWIVDNSCTPYVVVNANHSDAQVPLEYVENGQIVLNVSMDAVHELSLGNDAIDFMAKFHGITHDIHVPMLAVLAIYASENGQGMVFNDEETEPPPTIEKVTSTNLSSPASPGLKKKDGKKPSHLTVVK